MAGGIVTKAFEERADTGRIQNHYAMIQERIRQSLVQSGRDYTGIQLDGELYPKNERVIIGTHKGPMLAKFKTANPHLEIRNEIKKVRGDGKNSLVGRHQVELEWFRAGGCLLLVDPRSGRGGQETAGWSEYGVDFNKSGSIFSVIAEWLPQMGLSEVDPITMAGLLDGMSGKDNYTMLFCKAVMTLRNICVGYSVEDIKFQGASKLPACVVGTKRRKIGEIGAHECVIDLDCLTNYEALVAMISSMEYPAITCNYKGHGSVYSNISMPECDISFVSTGDRTINKSIPTPERWWKALVGLACKLGAVNNLIDAFRVTRGLASFSVGLGKLGFDEFGLTLGFTGTRGCRSVLMDSPLSLVDKIKEPTNLVCSLGELICDWAAGLEMLNMVFHISDEFGLANKDINRNVTGISSCSVGDSVLREGGFLDHGEDNKFLIEMNKRIDQRVQYIGDEFTKILIQTVTAAMIDAAKPGATEKRNKLRAVKNMAFTNYYGPLWKQNATVASRLEGSITSASWGATSRSKKDVFFLRMWMDINGLSDQCLLFGGFNAVQKAGVEAINHNSMIKVEGAHGVYSEVYREINWKDDYEVRVGSETREKDRLDFVKTYLGMEKDDVDDVQDIQQVEINKVTLERAGPSLSFRGTLGTEKVGKKTSKEDEEKESQKDKTGKDNRSNISDDVTRDKFRSFKEKQPTSGDKSTRATSEGYSTRGVYGFSRLIADNKGNMKVKKVVGDGLCVARAMAESMRSRGIVVTDQNMIELIRRETNDESWFDITAATKVINDLDIGLALYSKSEKTLSGLGTYGKDPNAIIGITYDGIHCDALVSGELYDEVITDSEVVIERNEKEMEEIWKGIFGSK